MVAFKFSVRRVGYGLAPREIQPPLAVKMLNKCLASPIPIAGLESPADDHPGYQGR